MCAGGARPGLVLSWPRAVVAAVVLGAGTIVLGALGSGYGRLALRPETGILWLQYLSAALGSGWAWALFAFALGFTAPTAGVAIGRGVAGLLVADAAYYVAKAIVGITDGVATTALVVGAVMALVVGPVMGWLGHLARRPGWLGLAAALAVPVVMVLDSRLRPAGPSSGPVPLSTIVGVAAVLLVGALVLRTGLAGNGGGRGIRTHDGL